MNLDFDKLYLEQACMPGMTSCTGRLGNRTILAEVILWNIIFRVTDIT